MPSIGDFSVTTFQGFLVPATRKSAILESDVGTDGVGVAFGGWAANAQSVTTQVTVDAGDGDDDESGDVNAYNLSQQYSASIGTVVTVTDQFNRAWPYTTILDVRTSYAQLASGGLRVTATWSLLPQTERPPGAAANNGPYGAP